MKKEEKNNGYSATCNEFKCEWKPSANLIQE